jgi:hypothetical protein
VTETIAASVQVVTATVTQTVTAPAGAVVSSTAVDALSAAPAVTSAAAALFRARNTPATDAQREAACNSTANIIQNPDFSQAAPDGSVAGWEVDNTDPNSTLDSVPTGTGNGTIAQFRSAAAGRELTVTQAMTLCPGQTYEFAASTEQADAMADCHCTFSLVEPDGTKTTILEVEPSGNWEKQNATFVAGAAPEADLQISARCDRSKDVVVSNQTAWMKVEVQGVSMVRDDDGDV